jgi:hypothetical protein
MEILSLNPINAANGPKDAFQKKALELFASGSDTRTQLRAVHGHGVREVHDPDVATSQTCVDCHNSYPTSPRRDFKIGDVVGGLR